MPVPRGTKFRYRIINPRRRQRLAFYDNQVIEVDNYVKRDGTWVKSHTRVKKR